VVTLIGDASIVNGVAMEGLNNAGTLKRQFLVVLNDNGMSIAKPQGAMASTSTACASARPTRLQEGAKEVSPLPGGSRIEEMYHRLGEMTKAMVDGDAWFEHFGLVTVGPIDGHDLPTLIELLNEVADIDRPMVLHVKTVKGKGFDFAEGDATRFHSPRRSTLVDGPVTGRTQRGGAGGLPVELKQVRRPIFTAAFADAMSI
jgi:1-deoxy-D-xylulose-5-phosphate synthase